MPSQPLKYANSSDGRSIEKSGLRVDDLKICYTKLHKPRSGCRLVWRQGNTYKYPQITMEDAETFLKNSKLILRSLSIDLDSEIANLTLKNIMKKAEDLEKFYECMKSLLGNREQLLKTEEIRLTVQDLSQAADFLKCIDPHSLKTISIIAYDYFWSIELDYSELELFVRSPKMKNFIIESVCIPRMKDEILPNFGQVDMEKSAWTWLEDIPGSAEKLQTTLNTGCESNITFSKV
ncbi:hypothetical protein CAEBREN_08983 [Caenorhabditis brenneri]|uniref:DUF38 domain-containing protein n=1 Tax=Caenorhabditis brenneri TaxID=135651 RepID=G0P387_CAEBE|nr:hypothetical protein CAEBREN_08983 [Caenorhabditis brenneri]